MKHKREESKNQKKIRREYKELHLKMRRADSRNMGVGD